MFLREKYQDPIVWNSETFASDVNAQHKKTAKQSRINRRGSLTQRFNQTNAKEEADWSRSTLVPTPAHVQRNTIDVPVSFPSSSPRAHTRQANNIIALVKERFRGAAYFNGKRDYFKLLRCYDRNKTQLINGIDFIRLLRRDGKLSKRKVPDALLLDIFASIVATTVTKKDTISHTVLKQWIVGSKPHFHKTNTTTTTTTSCFDRLSSPQNKTGVARHVHEQQGIENTPTKPNDVVGLQYPVSVYQQQSAVYVNSLREESRESDSHQHLKYAFADAGVVLRTKTAALGRASEKEYHEMMNIAEVNHKNTGAATLSAAGSSGYGRVSPLKYASPAQRRFSLVQGFVTKREDQRTPSTKGDSNGNETLHHTRFDASMHTKKKKQHERTKSRRQATRLRLGSPVQIIKTKIKAAAYDRGGLNYRKLFKHYDRNNSGRINSSEFISLMRRDAKLSPNQMSEEQLLYIFHHSTVDQDQTGAISLKDFIQWIEGTHGDQAMEEAIQSPPRRSPRSVRAKRISSKTSRLKTPATPLLPVPATPAAPTAPAVPLFSPSADSPLTPPTSSRKYELRRQQTRSKLLSMVSTIKTKLKAGCYSRGNYNYSILFRNNAMDDQMSCNEFVKAVRRCGKLRPTVVPTKKLEAMFQQQIKRNATSGPAVGKEQFLTWLTREEEAVEGMEAVEAVEEAVEKVEEVEEERKERDAKGKGIVGVKRGRETTTSQTPPVVDSDKEREFAMDPKIEHVDYSHDEDEAPLPKWTVELGIEVDELLVHLGKL